MTSLQSTEQPNVPELSTAATSSSASVDGRITDATNVDGGDVGWNSKRTPTKSIVLPGWTCQRFLLSLVDNVFSSLIVGPLTVAYWRGTWRLLDYHLVPDYQNVSTTSPVDDAVEWHVTPVASTLSGWICAIVGNVGLVSLVYCQTALNGWLKVDNVAHWLIGFHLYTYVMGFLNVSHWRGVSVLLDQYTGVGLVSSAVTAAIGGQGGIWLLRSSRSASVPPMVVIIDAQQDLFAYSTRFQTKAAERELHFLDTLLTVVVIYQLAFFYWRGSWELFDNLLIPDDRTASAVASLVLGYLLHALVCVLQPPFNVLYRKTFATRQPDDEVDEMSSTCRGPAVLRWFLEVLFFFLANLACVVHWRGVWMIIDVYVLPGLPDVSAGLTHVVGIVALWLMGIGHSVTMAGCLVEGGAPPEAGCLTNNDYVRHFVERCRRRRRSDSDDGVRNQSAQ